MTIGERWQAIRARVDAAAHAAGRAPGEVTVVAVSKFHPAEEIAAAIAAGATDLGENYAQELLGKQAALAASNVCWHFIGRLQSNKARLIAGQVALIHAVDSLSLATEISKRAAAISAVQPVLIAVNAADEASKGGVALGDVESLLSAMQALPGITVQGFMTMPPPSENPVASAPYFAALAACRDRLATAEHPLPVLSMGMSDDFEIAIAHGATHVRIGTAIFGPRPKALS